MKSIIGLIAIDADASALNNAGSEPGSATDNTIAVKKIKTKEGNFPYVSGQAWRFWWRQTLENKFSWKMSPITREKKIAFTEANPILYPDDDIFGYMCAKKIEIEVKGKKKSKNITVTRTSPLKNSALISISPVTIVDDFGAMTRQTGDPVPFEHQLYKAIMKGLFLINIDEVGKFYKINKSGFQNFREEQQSEIEKLRDLIENSDDECIEIKKEIKDKRISDTLSALPYIFGGAKSTLHLTDIAPKLIVIALFEGGNNIFSGLLFNNKGKPAFSIKNLKEIFLDYKDDFKSKIYIGIREGFLDNLKNDFEKEFSEKNDKSDIANDFIVTTPKEAISLFLEELNSKEIVKKK